jgi:carboxyl-terminal processing protease
MMGLRGQSATLPTGSGSTEANITRLTTNLLERSQFAHHPLDDDLAGKFLDNYLDGLDGTRSLFLQSDVDEFAVYRANLAQSTRRAGDTSAERTIFGRYLQRLKQRTAYVSNLLKTENFDFTGHDVYSFDREHAQRPLNLAAAQELWRTELRAEYLQEKLGDMQPNKIVDKLTNRHAHQLRTMQTLRGDELLGIYLNALAHVYDPHSDYLGHEQMESLSIAMNLSLFGIGATLETVDGYCKIREMLSGGPAARSGLLKLGDRIVAVAQAGNEPVDIMNMPISRAVELIRGPKGSTVSLSIIPAGAPDSSPAKTVNLVRDEIQLEDQRAKARILDLPTAKGAKLRLGVIDLPSFYADLADHAEGGRRSVTADVAQLLTKLKSENVKGLIIDLRHNGGGSLNEAVSLTGLFIHDGPVVQTRDPSGKVEVDADRDPSVLYDGPLIVLTSRFSASASEILAGALQDYGRAVLVGDSSTFGKGTVQTIAPLARFMDQSGLAHAYDPGALKITVSKFYRPSGDSTQLRGVVSDIVLPSTSDFSDISESAMKDPLPWDAVPPVHHEFMNRVRPYVNALHEKSTRRIKSEREFTHLAGAIAQLKKNLVTKSVSLNEAERRQELAQSKARNNELEQESKTHRAAWPTVYDITLKNSSSPGLPPPSAFAANPQKAGTRPSRLDNVDIGNPDIDSTKRSLASDIILNEGVHILADYVDVIHHDHSGAGAREGG